MGKMNHESGLMDQIASPENLLTAWRAVRGNVPQYRRARSAGPDGVTLSEFERDLPAQLGAMRSMLAHGRYVPQQPGRFTIAKRGGGTREIAILNISDRVAQRAVQQVIEPLWEPTFLPCSYGFRPGRSIRDAICCAQGLRRQGNPWVVDGDIASCFDSIDHALLMKRLGRIVTDRRVLDLIQSWLDAGIMRAHPSCGNEDVAVNRLRWLGQKAENEMEKVLRGLPGESDYAPDGSIYETMESEDWPERRLEPDRALYGLRRQSIQQIAGTGLVMGMRWVRPALSKLGSAASTVIQTPAGRRLLQKSVLATGGLAGVAIGAALASYLLYRKLGPAPAGVPQGSPLSPLLANIYLHLFDVNMTRYGYQMVRYADDWLILCPNEDQAELGYNEAVRDLAKIHLRVNREKTRIVSPQETVEWLGECIR